MRRLFCGLLLAVALSTSTGCFVPIYSGNPIHRARQLLFTSENMRMILEEWYRMWFLDMPSHLTPYRTHGGLI